MSKFNIGDEVYLPNILNSGKNLYGRIELLKHEYERDVVYLLTTRDVSANGITWRANQDRWKAPVGALKSAAFETNEKLLKEALGVNDGS